MPDLIGALAERDALGLPAGIGAIEEAELHRRGMF